MFRVPVRDAPPSSDRPGSLLKRRGLWLSCALFASGYIVGVWYVLFFAAHGGQAQFYQQSFDAAVLEACGRQFEHVARFADAPALASFLNLETDRFDCAALPSNLHTTTPDLLQSASRYLLAAAAAIWRIRGVSWSGLAPLFGLLYATAAVAIFWTVRAVAPLWFAAAVTGLLLASANQLNNLPHLRDYSKAPFILLLLAIAAWIVRQSWRPRLLIGLAAAAGVVNGLGIGFRTDLLIMGFLPLTAIALSQPDSVSPRRLKMAAAATLVAVAVFTSWPVLRAYQGGNNIWHVIVLGRMSPFDEALQRTSAVYSVGHFYNDSYVNVAINAYASRALGSESYLRLGTPEYERASFAYAREIMKTLPADTLERFFASAEKMISLAFLPAGAPQYARSSAVNRVYVAAGLALSWMSPYAWLLAALAFLLAAAANMRVAIWWVLAVAFLGAVPALQFHARHFFHLELLGWVLTGTIISGVGQFLRPTSQPSSFAGARRRWIVAAALLAVIVFGSWSSLLLLRHWQQNEMLALLDRYEKAPIHWDLPIEMSQEKMAQVRAQHAVVEVPASCDLAIVPIEVRYTATNPYVDLSETVKVDLPATNRAATRIFIPLYYDRRGANSRGSFAPERIVVNVPARCGVRQGIVSDTSRLPLMLYATLAPGWREGPLYQTRSGRAGWRTAFTAPSSIAVSRTAFDHVRPFTREAIAYHARIVDVDRVPFTAVGFADGAFTYLLQTRTELLPAGSLVLVSGEIFAGGITVGLERAGKWVRTVDVTTIGAFDAALGVTEGGPCTVVIANYLPNARHVRVRLERFGIVPPDIGGIAPSR